NPARTGLGSRRFSSDAEANSTDFGEGQLDSGSGNRHGWKLRSEEDRGSETASGDSRPGDAGYGRPRHAEGNHAPPPAASDRRQFAQHPGSVDHTASA